LSLVASPVRFAGEGFKHEPRSNHAGVLVATIRGWICPYCDYRLEDWLEA